MIVQLWVEADITFSMNGAEGTVTADGQVVTVRVSEPARLVLALPRGAGRVSQVADLLSSSGLRVEVQGPSGLLARAGSGVDSPLGGWVTGSRHVAPGSVQSLAPVVAARLRRPAVVGTLALLGGLVVRAAWRRAD